MSNFGGSFLWSQLVSLAPVLLAYLVGLVLALVFLGRTFWPSLLTLVAIAILLLTALGSVVATSYLIDVRVGTGWPPDKVAQAMGMIAIAGNCLRAGAIGLLLAAVFTGRRTTPKLAPPLVVPAAPAGAPDHRFTV